MSTEAFPRSILYQNKGTHRDRGAAMVPPRFVRAVDNTRSYGAHRYDLFGPKIGRRLTLFGRRTLDLLVSLEADPQALTYCERPLEIQDAPPSRLVDFWGRSRDGRRLCVVLRPAELTSSHGDIFCVPGIRVLEHGLFNAAAPAQSARTGRSDDARPKQNQNVALPGGHARPPGRAIDMRRDCRVPPWFDAR